MVPGIMRKVLFLSGQHADSACQSGYKIDPVFREAEMEEKIVSGF